MLDLTPKDSDATNVFMAKAASENSPQMYLEGVRSILHELPNKKKLLSLSSCITIEGLKEFGSDTDTIIATLQQASDTLREIAELMERTEIDLEGS